MALIRPHLARALGAVALFTIGACTQSLKLMPDDSATVLSQQTIAAPNPGLPGPHAVKTLYYGSGTDRQRAEYRDSVTLKTKPVDVTPFATVPPAQASARKKRWGFDLKTAPINGRVWYPEGAGPFPLVLIVHGNHNPYEFSDPGYGYLGELLASRGFILASVDQNFINGLSGENDGRAWLLLKHLDAWKGFTDSASSPLHGKVDWGRIALMGHSRGGEAAALAATFNRLKFYPDDAKQKFNFGYNIRGVVAIAPVDGQYRAASQFTPLENINYLVFHGSHDGDVSTFHGLRQYQRLQFTDGQPWFKSAITMYRANHGQWNTVWENKDNGPRSGRHLDLRALIEPDAQRQFGRVVIGAFLEAALNNKREYIPLFRDHRTAGSWLPRTMYTTRFQENGYRPLAEFAEDIDLTTGTAPGVVLAGDSLSQWRENVIPYRSRSDDQRQSGVWLGWNNRIAGPDTSLRATPARYTVTLPASLPSAWRFGGQSALYVSLAATGTTPGPRAAPRDTTPRDTATAGGKRPAAPKPPPPPKIPVDSTPVDLTIELEDAAGNVARVPLSHFGVARRPLDVRLFRRDGRDTQRFGSLAEIVPQTFVMPMTEFVRFSRGFDPARLRSIRLVFDRTVAGTVVVEGIGLSTPSDTHVLSAGAFANGGR